MCLRGSAEHARELNACHESQAAQEAQSEIAALAADLELPKVKNRGVGAAGEVKRAEARFLAEGAHSNPETAEVDSGKPSPPSKAR